jgi:hypothetical protein
VAAVVHDVFGPVEFGDGNCWDSEIEWAGGTVELDITFAGEVPDKQVLDGLAVYVSDLVSFDRTARSAMRADLAAQADGTDGESAVGDYLAHHLEMPDVVRGCFGVDDPNAVTADDFLTALRLVRVGLHVGDDTEEAQAVLDYTLDEEATQYLIVVKFGEDGAVREVCMES